MSWCIPNCKSFDWSPGIFGVEGCGLESQMPSYWLCTSFIYLFLTFNLETIIDSGGVAKIVQRGLVYPSFSFFHWFHLIQLSYNIKTRNLRLVQLCVELCHLLICLDQWSHRGNQDMELVLHTNVSLVLPIHHHAGPALSPFSHPYNFVILRVFCKQSHMICNLLRLACFHSS